MLSRASAVIRAATLACQIAGVGSALAAQPDLAGAEAAKNAEQRFGLPDGLLLAIGKVETGRAGPQGRMPWPWSINADGVDSVTPTQQAAVSQVQSLQLRGVRSIDTGCFQINLLYHPEAFASLDEAFDPAANAAYAARFLLELRGRSASWEEAVGLYHSATPWRGEHYRQLVWQAWTGSLMPETGAASASGGGSFGAIRVFTPTGAVPFAAPVSVAGSGAAIRGRPAALPGVIFLTRQGRLPIVFSPQQTR